MQFDDFFENKRDNHGNYRERRYHDDNRYSDDSSHSYQRQDDDSPWLNILEKIRGNKKLKLIIVLAGILVLAIAVVLIIVLLPSIMKLINYVNQNGIQGVLDGITGFLNKILNGSAK